MAKTAQQLIAGLQVRADLARRVCMVSWIASDALGELTAEKVQNRLDKPPRLSNRA
jgi:hypothetical protein